MDEIRVPLTKEELAAFKRAVLSPDFVGIQAVARNMQQVEDTRLRTSDNVTELHRAQGGYARMRIFLDFARQICMNETKQGKGN